jgi:hypothetical protein
LLLRPARIRAIYARLNDAVELLLDIVHWIDRNTGRVLIGRPFPIPFLLPEEFAMWRHVWALAAVGVLGVLGCGSAENGGESASMDEMAAAVSQPKSLVAEGTVVVREAEPNEDLSTASGKPDPSLPSKRGFALFDLSNEAAYVLLKAPADKVADALAKKWGGTVTKDVYGKPSDATLNGAVVFQLKGHPYSIYATYGGEDFDEEVATLSKELATDAVTFANSDFSGWSFVSVFRNGEEVEALHWGEDLTELGLAAPSASEWDTTTKITTDYGDGVQITDQWLFRSKLRKVTEAELQQGEKFNDAMFKQYDAFLPDADNMLWPAEDGIESPYGAEAFEAVHLVTMPE